MVPSAGYSAATRAEEIRHTGLERLSSTQGMRRSGEGRVRVLAQRWVWWIQAGGNLKVPSRSQPVPGITTDKGNETETETG